MAHTPIMLPDPYNFMRETMVERTGVELTPDGQFIVLIGSIKTPNCRKRKSQNVSKVMTFKWVKKTSQSKPNYSGKLDVSELVKRF